MKYKPYIFIEKIFNKPVITIFDGNSLKHQDFCSLTVDNTNNLLRITNICNITTIESGMIFHNLVCNETIKYFGDFMVDIIGNEIITMSTDGLFFATIYKTGSEYTIPSSGIGVNEEIFQLIKEILIEDNFLKIEVKDIDNYISDVIEFNKEIPIMDGYGTKHCKCQNKKDKN